MSVGKFGKPRTIGVSVDHIIPVPRPTAKLRSAKISKGTPNFFLRVHDKGSVLRDRLSDWTSLQQKEFGMPVRTYSHIDRLTSIQDTTSHGGEILARKL